MIEISEGKRLALAIDALATVVAEIVTERIRRLEEETERRLKELPARAADPVLTKKDVAERLKVTTRTVDNWMKKGKVPYVKMGRTVRLRWGEIEQSLAMWTIRRWR